MMMMTMTTMILPTLICLYSIQTSAIYKSFAFKLSNYLLIFSYLLIQEISLYATFTNR